MSTEVGHRSRGSHSLRESQQFAQSTRKLEEMLTQRLETERRSHRRGGPPGTHQEAEGSSSHLDHLHKEFQQKLQADLKETVKHIQEIQSIELRLPQNRPWEDVGVSRIFA